LKIPDISFHKIV